MEQVLYLLLLLCKEFYLETFSLHSNILLLRSEKVAKNFFEGRRNKCPIWTILRNKHVFIPHTYLLNVLSMSIGTFVDTKDSGWQLCITLYIMCNNNVFILHTYLSFLKTFVDTKDPQRQLNQPLTPPQLLLQGCLLW